MLCKVYAQREAFRAGLDRPLDQEHARWTSATPPPSGACTTSTTAACDARRPAGSSATRAQAQDVTQDVFLKSGATRRSSTPRRGELGSYLRLMARSRALDLWREGQAAGRAGDRLKVVVARDEPRVEDRPAAHGRARERARASCARRSARSPAPQREARRPRLLGRPDRRPDRPARSASRSGRPRAASASGWPSCASEIEDAQAARATAAAAVAAAPRRSTRFPRRMPVTGSDADPAPGRLLYSRRARARRAGGLVRRAHAHRARTTPTAARATAEEILGGPRRRRPRPGADLRRCTSPTATPAANDAVLAACAACDGRLLPLARVEPERRGRGGRGAALPGRGRAGLQAAPALATPSRCPTRRSRRSSRSPTRRARRCCSTRGAASRTSARPSSTSRGATRGRGSSSPTPASATSAWIPPHAVAAAEPLLRHRVVVRSPTSCSSTRTCRRAGSSTPATCPTAPGRWPRSSSAAARAAVGLGRRAPSGRSPAASSSASSPGRSRSTSARRPGPDALGAARGRRGARRDLRVGRGCRSPSAARTPRSRSQLARVACQHLAQPTRSPTCSPPATTVLRLGARGPRGAARRTRCAIAPGAARGDGRWRARRRSACRAPAV